MPHFSSSSSNGSGSGSAGTIIGTPSELIRLWRSRLSTSNTKATVAEDADDHQDNHHHRRRPLSPLEGVLSQQPKMSEIQDVSSVAESRESGDTKITRQKSEIDEDREDSEQRDASETPKSEMLRRDEAAANGATAVRAQPATTQPKPQQQQQLQQSRVGECNLLPVLVERLRSALELSCSSQSSEDQLPPEDSGVDSEEDFRLWTTLGVSEQQQEALNRPKLDLKFLEDLLLADIHTALARLQDTLKRVDINTLTRYNASLDPSNKLYLLRLISNLLSKLKVPEDAIAGPNEPETRFDRQQRRRKNERHTISVSADEVARAKLWLDDKSVSSNESSPQLVLDKENEVERIVEGAPSSGFDLTEITVLDKTNGLETPMTYEKGAINDKCMKDAINQQQSLQNKNNRESVKDNRSYDPLDRLTSAPRRFDGFCKDDISVNDSQERGAPALYYQQHSTVPSRHNKFIAKKSKIKRANTIDIPSYLQFKSDSPDHFQNGCFALRRPIEVGDKITNGSQRVVPSFEPKTDNDRKFLALINKNNDSNTSNSSSPFKSFNYRQSSSAADKNWSNRFSSIKTNFDKHSDTEEQPRKKTSILDVKKKFEYVRDDSLEREGMVLGSVRVPYGPAKQKQSCFTHAPSSPFQKIERSSPKSESVPPFLKASYIPKNSSMLQAKLKMFDQDSPKNDVITNPESASSGVKSKYGKPPDNNYSTAQPINKRVQDKKVSLQPVENGHHNYYSFCKQLAPFASGKTNSTEGKSNVNAAKTKLLVNLNKESDKPVVRKDKSKASYEESKNFIPRNVEDNRHDFSKQYSYHKPYDNYNAYQDGINRQNMKIYRHLDELPQTKNHCGIAFGSSQANDFIIPDKREKKFEIPTQNVAVQTTNESNERRPSEVELINTMADVTRNYQFSEQRKLRNNASVQTTDPGLIAPIHPSSYTQTSTSPSIVSPIPQLHPTYKPSLPVTNDSVYPSADKLSLNYKGQGYLADQSYHQPGSYPYSSIPYDEQPTTQNYPTVNNFSSINYSSEPSHMGISQKLYNEFSKLPESKSPQDYPVHEYSKKDSSVCTPASVPLYRDVQPNGEESISFKPSTCFYEDKPLPDLVEENIENQDISSDGIVTRYTCAIATVSSQPECPKSPTDIQAPQSYEPVIPRIKEPQQRHYAETTGAFAHLDRQSVPDISKEEIHRHNMLQQSLIRRMQNDRQQQPISSEKILPGRRLSQEIGRKENRSPPSPSFDSANYPGRVCALKALTESHKAQEKISLFEEKSQKKQLFQPLNLPPSKTNPSSIQNERSPIRSPIDSSDEYLMSCANKPSRNIVLSKSESWHQLALANKATGGLLQLPQPTQQKPPKPKSPSSLRLSKQFEASLASDNARKMEEKIQRYFQGSSSTAGPQPEEPRQTNRRESKSKRNLQSRKSMNSLMRSQTMPHLYDDRLFDENVDVDKAFDSIFKEATRTDNRH